MYNRFSLLYCHDRGDTLADGKFTFAELASVVATKLVVMEIMQFDGSSVLFSLCASALMRLLVRFGPSSASPFSIMFRIGAYNVLMK